MAKKQRGTLPQVKALLGVNLKELGDVAGCTASGIHLKLSGARPWKLDEAHAIARHLAAKYNVTATVEELFGLEDV